MCLIINENVLFTSAIINADGISFHYYKCSAAVGLINVHHTLTFLCFYVIVIISMCLGVPV